VKALVYEEYTTDDDFAKILKIKDIDEPKLKPKEVVFKVKVAALNYDDIWGMRGKPIEIPMPHISGTDAAGEVVAVGEDVNHIKIGDRIVSHANLSCRICNACTSGREYDCRYRKIWGFETGPLWGGYCEFTHLPEVMGTFGIQIAKLYNCDVIATAGPAKLDKCIELGADYAVDHRKEDWHKEVRAISKEIAKKKGKDAGIDVIYEHIGGTHWNKELTLLKYGATVVTTGATTGYDVQTDLRHVFFKGINILGSTQGTRAELEQGLYWMSQRKIKAIIDSEYTFEQAVEAHTKMLKGKGLFGKILMKPK
jgi:NADPH:quinone reductase-like Zn-dependent oxidoreductase